MHYIDEKGARVICDNQACRKDDANGAGWLNITQNYADAADHQAGLASVCSWACLGAYVAANAANPHGPAPYAFDELTVATGVDYENRDDHDPDLEAA